MLFHEIYGSYYKVMAEILKESLFEKLSAERIRKIVDENAFEESILHIPEKISGEWGLISENGRAVVHHVPSRPETLLQKSWIRSILDDPKMLLFLDEGELEDLRKQLADTVPLYSQRDIVYFDRNAEGDPYEDTEYVTNFRKILQAIREGRRVTISYASRQNTITDVTGCPLWLEYSEKDDIFRFYLTKGKEIQILRVAGIKACHMWDDAPLETERGNKILPDRRKVTFLLADERNALERALLEFSTFEKEVRKIKEGLYEIMVSYDAMDENEMLIRLLALGPVIRMIEPEGLIKKIQERLQAQMVFTHRQ